MKLKLITSLVLTLFLVSMLTLALNIQPVEGERSTWTVDDDGPANFHTIQEAINAASPEDTIKVSSGTYYEHVVLNKTVSLIGVAGTIIDASLPATVDPSAAQWNGMTILEDHCTIEGFEIRNAGNFGIEIRADHGMFRKNLIEGCNWAGISCYSGAHDGVTYHSSHDNLICNNKIIKNGVGVWLNDAYNNIVKLNIIEWNKWNGIYLSEYARNNEIANNFVSESCRTPMNEGGWGLAIGTGSHDNTIVSNTFSKNKAEGVIIHFFGSFGLPYDNLVYHNNFIDNEVRQAYDAGNNIWDNGYPSGGNYWSDYTGVDVKSGPNQDQPSSDGIGDTPYVINGTNQDNYPLMYPWAPEYNLTIYSSPTGVTFTVDGVSHTTPWSGTYSEGASVSLVMPETHDGYLWSHWLEDGDTNRIKTVTINTNITLTGVFTPVPTPPVGGIIVHINKSINKLELLIPYIGVISVILAITVVVKKKKLIH